VIPIPDIAPPIDRRLWMHRKIRLRLPQSHISEPLV
jgi:hypothetical protein